MGLALDGRQIDGVVLHRSNGSFRMERAFHFTLSLDPLTNAPELVGREIRNHLDEAGIRERKCAVCLPLSWVLALSCAVPDIPEADVAGFLQLEAEQNFPYALADLTIATSRFTIPEAGQHALVAGVPRNHVAILIKALQTARLNPVGISLGTVALDDKEPTGTRDQFILGVRTSGIEMLIRSHGGIAALRNLEGDGDSKDAELDPDLIAREIRITLGQLPKAIRDSIRHIQMFGSREVVEPLSKKITPLAQSMGLAVERRAPTTVEGGGDLASMSCGAISALGLASRYLLGKRAEFEFLPPKVKPWAHLTSRFASRRLAYAGVAAALLLLLFGSAFAWQQWQLSSRESQWQSIQKRVAQVEEMQQKARKYRPWFDESLPGLRIMQRVTEAFPEEGSVTAKTLQIKDLTDVTCSGQARNIQSLGAMREKLGKSQQVADLKTQKQDGTSPLQFMLSFHWVEGGGHGN